MITTGTVGFEGREHIPDRTGGKAKDFSALIEHAKRCDPPMFAIKLAKELGVDVNDLPISYNITWYEQKAVLVLLALLHLGVKNIHLGPTLPAFVSPDVLKVLVDNFRIDGIGTVDEDVPKMMG